MKKSDRIHSRKRSLDIFGQLKIPAFNYGFQNFFFIAASPVMRLTNNVMD